MIVKTPSVNLYINKFYLGWQRPDLIRLYVATIANEAVDLYQGLPVPILQVSLDVVPRYRDSIRIPSWLEKAVKEFLR